MRWPLRYQIMLPMAVLMALAVAVVGGLDAWLSVRATRARIESQIAGVTRILAESNFPLTDAVLRQMKVLSGADMVLVDTTGLVMAASSRANPFTALVNEPPKATDQPIALGNRLWSRHDGYFHARLRMTNRATDRAATLHILYPEGEYRRAWQRAVYPSLGFVVLALPVIVMLAAATSARISGRVSRLQGQVDRIAEGDFQQLALSQRDDELRALGRAVNRMAAMLARYEEEVRRTERMRTLAQLGGGIAHQLRNSVTGCGMALDLHAQECASANTNESLDVAKRQLRLMEEYIQRFLQLGKPTSEPEVGHVDLAALVADLLPLVEPAARHAGVELVFHSPTAPATITGNTASLSQLVINLLLNAIEAAAQGAAQTGAPARVAVAVNVPSSESVTLTVSDSGLGPNGTVRDHLFEPFVSEKPDGAGLGLSVAREVVHQHAGRIDWRRTEGITQFTVELPAAAAISHPLEVQRA